MNKLLLALVGFFILYLLVENFYNNKNRKKLKHIIHVNGIRGKSSVTRLIHSGLNGNGIKSFAKTTGTLPMTINTKNQEELIQRRGRANIREQIFIMKKAVLEGAEVLAIECMAVQPRLQFISQHNILKSDIGIITNVRLDHTEEMGETLEEICESLANTIPKNGILITSEEKYFEKLKSICEKLNTKIIKVNVKDTYNEINFKENVACALEVCKLFGIEEEDALIAMKNFIHDPYDLRVYKLNTGAIFVNGLSINDPDSSEIVYKELEEKYNWQAKKLVLLINNRPDRGYRANHMVELTKRLLPDEVLIMGSFTKVLKRNLLDFDTKVIDNVKNLDFNNFDDNNIIFAVGNIANDGDKILEKIRNEGDEHI